MSRGLVAVLDLGRTSLRVLALSPEGDTVLEHRAASPVRPGPPYPHLDLPERFARDVTAFLTDPDRHPARITSLPPNIWGFSKL